MTKEEQLLCLKIFKQYLNAKQKRKIERLRNMLYFLLKQDLSIWIKNILRKWRIRYTEEELLSHTWHCYVYSLERYTNLSIPIPYHFYTYSLYCLYGEYVLKKDKINYELIEYSSISTDYSIKELHDRLPATAQRILKDILTCNSTNNTKSNYYIHKRILKKELRSLYG